MRTVVVWCPDWPVRASGADPTRPVAVVHANRVVACSAVARAEGVRIGQRRRQAEAACAGLVTVARDPDRDARAFEPVVAAVAAVCPLVEVVRPGLVAFAARGPARFFGGEAALLHHLTDAVSAAMVGMVGLVGIAEGCFAATLAARRGRVVPPGETPEFLAPLPVGALDISGLEGAEELAGLLGRLGIRTLGRLAALPAPQVLARFGGAGAAAHRLARGLELCPLDARRPPDDLTVSVELDPPVERVDTAAFAAKALADRLHEGLAERGLQCTLVRIEAESEHGELLSRCWRHDGTFGAATLAERVRWQLDGWISGPVGPRPTAGVTLLRLVPEEVVADQGSQQGFWGGVAEADRRAARVLARLQGLLGPDGVLTTVVEGGRAPGERVRAVAWGDRGGPLRPPELPWPGRVPPPAPTLVPGGTAALRDAAGDPVVVTGRAEVAVAPATLDGAAVVSWSAPWPCHERWWDPEAQRRRARMQVVTDDGRAVLLAVEQGSWSVEAVYD
jgi:protein ImuB